MGATLVCADVVQWASATPPIGAHALIADAPYELNFMSKNWDNTGIAFRPETWKALAQHLLPGAFIMVFASSRGYHRMACAIEDAGFIMHPAIGWLQGSGFPKSTKIDDERFRGHRYGRQAFKPAIEFVAVAQRPYQGSPGESIRATGAGSLWIDGGRIGAATNTTRVNGHGSGGFPHSDDAWMPHVTETGHVGKRWPPNFALCHIPGCTPVGAKTVQGSHDGVAPGGGVSRSLEYGHGPHGYESYTAPDGTETVQAWACAEGCPVHALDLQAGHHKAGGAKDCQGQEHGFMSPRTSTRDQTYESYGDDGPCSRFFQVSAWSLDVAEQLAQADPVRYCPKASKRERDSGLEGMPLSPVWDPLSGEGWTVDARLADGGYVHQGNAGRNPHPTVKPLALLKWLATLLLPPAAYAPRRLLVPFSGTSSEIIGGMLAGFDEIIGIEQDAHYVDIGRRRVAWWTGYTPTVTSPTPPSTADTVQDGRGGQLSLF